MSSGCFVWPRWLSASIVSPEPMAASPTQTAIRCRRAGSAGGADVARRRQADADAHAGPGVAAVEDVVLALAAAREAADAADLAQGVEPVPSVGEQLVGVGLVPGVPHDPVARRVHDAVQRERDLDRAERAGEVAAGLWTVRIIFSRSSAARVSSCSGVMSWSCAGSRIVSSRVKETCPPWSHESIGPMRSLPSDERLLEYVTALDLDVPVTFVEPMRTLARAPRRTTIAAAPCSRPMPPPPRAARAPMPLERWTSSTTSPSIGARSLASSVASMRDVDPADRAVVVVDGDEDLVGRPGAARRRGARRASGDRPGSRAAW